MNSSDIRVKCRDDLPVRTAVVPDAVQTSDDYPNISFASGSALIVRTATATAVQPARSMAFVANGEADYFDEEQECLYLDSAACEELGVSSGERVEIEPAEAAPLTQYTVNVTGVSSDQSAPDGSDSLEKFIAKQVKLRIRTDNGDYRPILEDETLNPEGPARFTLTTLLTDATLDSSVGIPSDETNVDVKFGSDVVASTSTGEVTFEDIVGVPDAKTKLERYVMQPLRNPDAYFDASPPTGVLLHGPSGTGKTSLVKAVVNELDDIDVSLVNRQATALFASKYGETTENIKQLFAEARKEAPAIVFIDEIDALGTDRSGHSGRKQGTGERSALNSLQEELSGIQNNNDRVMVIGATNRLDNIDSSLKRSGRLGKKIEVSVPDADGREEILLTKLEGNPVVASKSQLREFACTELVGFTGSDIQDIVTEAVVVMQDRVRETYPENDVVDAVRRHNEGIRLDDIRTARERDSVQPSLLQDYAIEVPDVTYNDIGGQDDVISELLSRVEGSLQAPDLFDDEESVTGMLFHGPAGTGKTMMAKAVANEASRTFVSKDASSLRGGIVGETERQIRDLFTVAKQLSPSVVFLDEIDAIARERSTDNGGSNVNNAAVGQLLTELDGMDADGDVIVVGATNRLEDIDAAVKREGRLTPVEVGYPDEKGRRDILQIHLNDLREDDAVGLADDVSADDLVDYTDDETSGADVAGAMQAAKRRRRQALVKEAGSWDAASGQTIRIREEDIVEALQS